MLERLRHWREARTIKRLDISMESWEQAVAVWPVVARYRGAQREKLYRTSLLLLADKAITAADDLALTRDMQLLVATMAAVPVLEIGRHWYRGWSTIILYESAFVPEHEWQDEYGIVHTERHALSGEAWLQGPVILSWEDVLDCRHERNVVIHELSHKLDMLNGDANGFPPLHRGMDGAAWYKVFTDAWQQLDQESRHHQTGRLDDYGLTDEGEFFSVASETFFQQPRHLKQRYPALYQQLSLFYQQTPDKPHAGQ
jgi:Mlc titration factor MtfA (ptsG expression regulator)